MSLNQKMFAFVQVKKGTAAKAFELQEVPLPQLTDNSILIKVEAFGLNFADGLAIKGQYQDAPKLPAILGYDVCGRIIEIGKNVTMHQLGDRVTAMTRFGGYAQYAITDERAAVKIKEDTGISAALSMATQASTAWYCAEEICRINEGDRVVITAAAGGVGSLLVQLAKRKKAKIFGIVSSEAKEELVIKLGAHATLNRSKGDVFKQYISMEGKGTIDLMFDSAGGSYIRKGIANLAPGGRLVGIGAAQMPGSNNIFSLIGFALSFGIYHPIPFLMNSHSFSGVNMLRVADYKPALVQHCMLEAMKLFDAGALIPLEGKVYNSDQLVEAHNALAKGLVPGKIAVKW